MEKQIRTLIKKRLAYIKRHEGDQAATQWLTKLQTFIDELSAATRSDIEKGGR